jgi:glutathione S-transferase
MGLLLYAHPFSSYCMKVLVALYERNLAFELKLLATDQPENGAEFAHIWPMQHMPLLVDDGRPVRESSIIIEHLDLAHPGAGPMAPNDPKAALEARFLDRVFDNYVMSPMQRIVFDCIREPADRDGLGVQQARDLLDRAYAWLDKELPRSGWPVGNAFGLADCAAAPALLYADWVHPIPEVFANLRAYRGRLLQRPSVSRVIEDARPFRHLFPPGAPQRD